MGNLLPEICSATVQVAVMFAISAGVITAYWLFFDEDEP